MFVCYVPGNFENNTGALVSYKTYIKSCCYLCSQKLATIKTRILTKNLTNAFLKLIFL